MLLLAVIERDPDVIEHAYRVARELPEDDPVRKVADALAPTVLPGASLTSLGDAVALGSRTSAAAAFAEQLRELRTIADDALLRGLEITADALALAQIDLDSARGGLADVWRHWRGRARAGETPPVALAGIEILIDLLLLEPDEARGDVLVELVEALSDAGLSTAGPLASQEHGSIEGPSLAEAQLATTASEGAAWPRLGPLMEKLDDTNVLYLRAKRLMSDRRLQVLVLHIVPPDGLSIRQHVLSETQYASVRALGGHSPAGLRRLSRRSVDQLVEALLPQSLASAVAAGSATSVVVVPDTTLWPVPWQWARPFDGATVSIAQSLSTWTDLVPAAPGVQHVVAVVDESIVGAAPLTTALTEARRNGRIRVTSAATLAEARAEEDVDLLLVYAHGAGRGLDYRLALPGGDANALELATKRIAPRVLIAACSSGGPPPEAFPLSLANALMLNGTSTVIAGLWPLPAITTGRVLGETVRALAAEPSSVVAALSHVVRGSVGPVIERLGLQLFGLDDRSRRSA